MVLAARRWFRIPLVALFGAVLAVFVPGTAVAADFLFSNPAQINVGTVGPANPYPSQIQVAGVPGPPSQVSQVRVVFRDIGTVHAEEDDALLVSPAGAKVMLMSDACGPGASGNATYVFDDRAPSGMTTGAPCPTGDYRPTDFEPSSAEMPAPAPFGPYGTSLAAFNSAPANGTWSLYINDDTDPNILIMNGGWELRITTSEPGPPAVPAAPAASTQKRCRKGRKLVKRKGKRRCVKRKRKK